jgi:hypothetical protein
MKHFRKMTFTELLDFAEEQERMEAKTSDSDADPRERNASWAETAEILRTVKKRGVPPTLQDPPEG